MAILKYYDFLSIFCLGRKIGQAELIIETNEERFLVFDLMVANGLLG